MAAAARGRCMDQPLFANSEVVAHYLMLGMSHLRYEQVRVLFLTVRNGLIGDEVVARGTVDQAPIYPREILKRALDIGAAGIVLAHNHPSGDRMPSAADVQASRALRSGGEALGVALLDHLILARSGWTSLRAEGLI
jgi:DNA repair protein RadC